MPCSLGSQANFAIRFWMEYFFRRHIHRPDVFVSNLLRVESQAPVCVECVRQGSLYL